MATSPRAFRIELYNEHLEEASFLFQLRRSLHTNPEVSWKKVADFEERLEAHLDALVVGGELALDVCKRHATAGDAGEVFACVSLFCRQDKRDLVLAVFDQLDPADAEKASAIADALKYELPGPWHGDFLTLLGSGDPKLAPILARAFGYRRVQCGPQLLTAMKRCAAAALPEVVWALGRIRYEPAAGPLLDYLKSEDEPVRAAAALALLRMGEPKALDHCLDEARRQSWPMSGLGLAGGRSALGILTERAKNAGGPDSLHALGLLGDAASVPLLISALSTPDGAEPAATALQCLTGAGLTETVFIPEEPAEDELFDSERELLKQGKALDRGDGRPFGSTVTRILQKPEDWTQWWSEHGLKYKPGFRYRNGVPHAPGVLVELLAAENTPHILRRSCLEELVTRYGKDLGVEPDSTVRQQIAALNEATKWGESTRGQFQDGAWYFAGQRRE